MNVFILLLICLTYICECQTKNLTLPDELYNCRPSQSQLKDSEIKLPPTVMIAILARNKAHTLPYFLGSLEALSYPKQRIALWIRTDHNTDNTIEVLDTWLKFEQDKYNSVDYEVEESPKQYADETSPFEWTPTRYEHVIRLREEALQTAANMWADLVWFLDCDALITNPDVLKKLIQQKKMILAPMLQSTGAYSNFWCGMTEKLYYKRTSEYMPIVEREKTGCFEVPMVHSCTLVDLRYRKSQKLTFDSNKLRNYTGPVDDIIIFSQSALQAGIHMHILSIEHFGYIMSPLEKTDTFKEDHDQLVNLKLEALVEGPALYSSTHLQSYTSIPQADTLGFDEVYLINLERRVERRERMLASFRELGIKTKQVQAVDGKNLTHDFLVKLGVKMLPGYQDPYKKRGLTMGEIGCFLSHYNIWKDIIKHQHRRAIIFEDDIRFEHYFRLKLDSLMRDAQSVDLRWDLIYLGRKRLADSAEPLVAGTRRLVHVDYSYWTLCYILTLDGARKLVEADPLGKILPVDEYLPIMFDRHPNVSWKNAFSGRDLRAFSANPLLVFPTHYTGEPNYVSDTEDSQFISSEEKQVTKDEL